MHEENFDEAIVALEVAKKMMPSDHKAQTLIDQSNKLKEGKKAAEKQAEFDAKITAGEDFLKDNRFDEAIAAFEEAQRILPNDHKPASLITQTNDLRKAKENEIAKIEYDELIALGDKNIEDEKFSEARENFKNALKAYAEGQSTVDARLAKVDSLEKLWFSFSLFSGLDELESKILQGSLRAREDQLSYRAMISQVGFTLDGPSRHLKLNFMQKGELSAFYRFEKN